MIDVEDLIALVRNYNPRCNADLIRRAYAYGMKMHEGQMRKSGELYFTHPVAVAAILGDGLDRHVEFEHGAARLGVTDHRLQPEEAGHPAPARDGFDPVQAG